MLTFEKARIDISLHSASERSDNLILFVFDLDTNFTSVTNSF